MTRFSIHYLERVAHEWQRAYEEANDKTAPAVTWANGWFRIGDDRKKYRRKEFEHMRDNLRKVSSTQGNRK